MQPSLFGIHYEPLPEPGLFDSHPLRYLKWMVFGEWYVEIKADTAGRVRGPIENGGESIFDIGGLVHRLPHEMNILIKAGDDVVTGQVIARGCRVTGDHLFVNRVKWNFVRPRRGDVMVFRTDNIPALDAKKTHYIKRLSGLPNETIGIVPPNLIVDGKAVVDDARIRTIAIREPGYFGYTLAFGVGADYIYSTNSVVKLKRNQYLGLGDNTRNSLDSRYWGPVPQDNLVGPACLVYWPISRRTGFVR
jgi:signal peptidase I